VHSFLLTCAHLPVNNILIRNKIRKIYTQWNWKKKPKYLY
jgi:hypothetical protein